MADRRGVAVAGALALGMYSCTRTVPGAVFSSSEEEEELGEDGEGDGLGLPAHLGGIEPAELKSESAAERPAVRLSVCSSCMGSKTLLSDLEDICSWVDIVQPRSTGCLGACGMGPNATSVASDGHVSLHTGIGTLDEAVRVTQAVARQADPRCNITIPDEVLARIQLRSDGSRLASSTDPADNTQAELLFTQALDAEQIPAPAPDGLSAEQVGHRRSEQIRKLHMLRSSVRASQALQDYDGAIADCDRVLESSPTYSQAHLQKANLLRRARRTAEALACFEKAHELGSSPEAPDEEGYRMDRYMLKWLTTVIDTVRERLAEDAAIQKGEFGMADAGDEDCDDSGDGSGRWLVQKIEGMAPDSCIYHLTNHPPAMPHPYPHSAWHVNVCIGGTVREYTPVSTAKEWEQGSIKLLVKSYSGGQVSKRFAKLRQVSEYGAPLEEQNCWVLVSAPVVTLHLPHLTPTGTPRPTVTHVAIVVGGTGVAPALQILREIADGSSNGAFSGATTEHTDVFETGDGCSATLLYSSRTAQDVLCIDELRAVVESADGRITVRHTLTDAADMPAASGGARADAEQQPPARCSPSDPQWIPGRHYHFPSKWNPFKPRSGPLRTTPGVDQEAGLRGRVDKDMLTSVLPTPGEGVVVVVCGPPSMWEDMQAILTSIGHADSNLVELKALSDVQIREQAAARGIAH